MELSGFDIIGAHILSPKIVNEKEKICKVPIEIELKQKVAGSGWRSIVWKKQ